MCKKLTIVLLIFFSQHIAAEGSYYFEYNASLKACYNQVLNLDFNSARKTLHTIQSDQPYNLAALHIENYIDFFELFVQEDRNRFTSLKKNKNRRIRYIKKHLPQGNAYRNFAVAEINLQWSLTRAKFGELFRAGHELYTAFNYLEKNEKSFPDFAYNKKSLSLLHALIETVELPGFVKNVFGIKGSINQALNEIQSFIKWSECEQDIFLNEAHAIYSYILYYQKLEKKEAFDVLEKLEHTEENKLLSRYLTVHLLQYDKKNDEAIAFFDKNFSDKEFQKFPYLYFLKANCYLKTLNPEAKKYFELFLKNYKGEHYIKEAYQKLAWLELVCYNNSAQYKYYMSKVLTEGSHLMGADEHAYNEAKANEMPHVQLLKSRILFDGAYYAKALDLIKQFEKFNNANLESEYRKARIYQEQKLFAEAIKMFRSILKKYADEKDYRICNAALQLAIILEQTGRRKEAEDYYKLCLKINPSDYKRSLHQKAKSGLDRLEKW